MPIATKLSMSLGPVIAKALLTFWLGDKAVVLSVGTSLVDLIKMKESNEVTQKKMIRQFEEIGEKVAESLLPIFENDGANIDKACLKSIIHEVKETIVNSEITIESLIDRNLEPELLYRHFISSNSRPAKHFSESEYSLYRRVLDEVSQRIIDTSSNFPQFTERLSSEILKGSRKLVESSDEILYELSLLRKGLQKENEALEAIRFEEKYKLQVGRELDYLELFGVDISNSSRRHSLSVAYISLSVARCISDKSNAEKSINRVGKNSPNVCFAEDIVSIDFALKNSNRLLIRGEAGSGKTTLLKWIAINSASKTFKGRLTDWNNTIPFFIRLRDYADGDFPTPELFPKPLAPLIYNQIPENWVHKHLDSENAIVLIDGIDEVPISQRSTALKWINDLVSTFPKTRYIVTSRPHALEDKWNLQDVFDESELQPMDIASIYQFIDHWHNAVQVESSEDEKDKIDDLSAKLKKVIKYNKSLRKIAISPLLCAMICALHRDRHQKLPSNRVELYDACTYMLLERRDDERGVNLKDYAKLTYTQKRYLLENFAYWLVKNNKSSVSKRDSEEYFDYKLSSMNNIPEGTNGLEIVRLLVERSGIIREAVAGYIDFTHKTFQEFLAAHAAINEREIGLLEQNSHNDQWRETIILACGIARGNLANELLEKILKRGDNEKDQRHKLHLLAMSCLETSIELDVELKNEIEIRLEGVIPPNNLREAEILATTGDLAVPYLEYVPRNNRTNIACIKTLIRIGSEDALTMLETYVDINNSEINNELINGWDEFNIEDYAKRILTNIREISSTDLSKIQYLPNLENLTIAHADSIDLLINSFNIRRLELSSCIHLSNLDGKRLINPFFSSQIDPVL